MTVRFKETSWEAADSSMFESKGHRPSYTRHIRNSHHSTWADPNAWRNEDEEIFVPASYTKPRTQQEIDQELDNFWKWIAKSREEYK
jgi:hypothetical protein